MAYFKQNERPVGWDHEYSDRIPVRSVRTLPRNGGRRAYFLYLYLFFYTKKNKTTDNRISELFESRANQTYAYVFNSRATQT